MSKPRIATLGFPVSPRRSGARAEPGRAFPVPAIFAAATLLRWESAICRGADGATFLREYQCGGSARDREKCASLDTEPERSASVAVRAAASAADSANWAAGPGLSRPAMRENVVPEVLVGQGLTGVRLGRAHPDQRWPGFPSTTDKPDLGHVLAVLFGAMKLGFVLVAGRGFAP